MNRLQKKCLIAAIGTHLLVVVAVLCSGFITSKPKPDDTQVLDVIPASLIDAAFNSGVKGAQPPPPAPVVTPQPQPPAPQPVVAPQPQPEPPKPVVKPEPVKPQPEPVKPEKTLSPDDLKAVVRTAPKNVTPQTAQDDSQKKLQQQRNKALQTALRNLKQNLTPGTTIDMPGDSSAAYANYASVVKSIYENAWRPPDDTASDDANTKVSVTIASDGTVISAQIVTPAGDASVDASVQRTLDRVTFIAPFPEGTQDKERTYIINFNLKAKRMLG
jgi:TonB family protein